MSLSEQTTPTNGSKLPARIKRYVWAPQEGPQAALVKCPADEIFYGGARGGGKTDGMLGKFGVKSRKYGKGAVGIFFRRTREDLREAIERSREIYGKLADWKEQQKEWRFHCGARLKFAYLDRDADADNYQGHSYSDVFFEELTHWPDPKPINKLRATLRSAIGVPCQLHATGNPGGPGHNWVKARYIDPAPGGWELLTEEFENPFTGERVVKNRVFIPSRLSDNHYLGSDYVANLYQSGSVELVRAWLEGDWSAIEGAFFDCWSAEKHIVRPFEVPAHWTRFVSMDWGSAAPFSVGWWAVAGETVGRIPRGCLVRYREWYGEGKKLTAEDVAHGILEREARAGELRDATKAREQDKPHISYGVLDPSAFAQDGGPSIAERMARVGTLFRHADNKRVSRKGAMGGWDQMRSRMKGDADGNPMLVVVDTCKDFIRTVPVLQHDSDYPEDLDTTAEDHAADDTRYACMSRPYLREAPAVTKPQHAVIANPDGSMTTTMSFNDLVKRNAKLRKERRR